MVGVIRRRVVESTSDSLSLGNPYLSKVTLIKTITRIRTLPTRVRGRDRREGRSAGLSSHADRDPSAENADAAGASRG
ncbi:hypothetical protein GCM10027515_05120 [Schumannella luteola]